MILSLYNYTLHTHTVANELTTLKPITISNKNLKLKEQSNREHNNRRDIYNINWGCFIPYEFATIVHTVIWMTETNIYGIPCSQIIGEAAKVGTFKSIDS